MTELVTDIEIYTGSKLSDIDGDIAITSQCPDCEEGTLDYVDEQTGMQDLTTVTQCSHCESCFVSLYKYKETWRIE